ncbi:transcriptional regulator [Tistrella mobilis]|uniref:helix-turn-helix transcriptional regulator n=1 Tax=Tistrella mobilis TaxID=171437 RepID=UPI0031F721BB
MSSFRNAQLLRLLGMIRDLSSARTGVSIRDLRERYGVTRRTIERDMAAIEAVGYTVETLPDLEPGHVRKRIPASVPNLQMPLTAEELAAARAGVAALERDAPASVAATLRLLVHRLEEAQTQAVAVDGGALDDAQAFVPRPGHRSEASAIIIEDLRAAILRCERVHVTYRKGGEGAGREYEAEPYGILYGAKGYLVWRGVEDRKWRKFALPFIDKVTLTGAPFERDSSFQLAAFATDSFGIWREEPVTVELRVLPSGQARLRHHRFHPTETVEPQPDGGAIVRFTASGLTEICWHLFTWGADIRVLGPEGLVEAYSRALHSARSALEDHAVV